VRAQPESTPRGPAGGRSGRADVVLEGVELRREPLELVHLVA
jgi:hypothetical protein